jgi:hypothetical protein
MGATALDHWLVRAYLRELDAALRGVPAAQARELTEQITAHLEDALGPAAGDQEVAAALSRLGSPADLAAEAGAASGSSGARPAVGSPRMRWRLAVVIAVPTVIAAVLGALQISSDVSNAAASGRDQHLAQLNAAVVTLTQDLEDERDLSAGYAAHRQAGPVPATLADARTATDAAARTVRADAANIGAGYQPGTVQALQSLLAGLNDLGDIRAAVSSPDVPAQQVIRVYTANLIALANTFSAVVGGGTSDTRLQNGLTTLAALLGVENEMSVQRAVLFAALRSPAKAFAPAELNILNQAYASQLADQADFNASTNEPEQEYFTSTVSGPQVDAAATQQILAEAIGTSARATPLTAHDSGLTASRWYGDMSTTIGDTRKVVGQLTGQITDRANTLKSDATRRLLLTGIATLVLLLVLLISAVLARPPRKRHADTLEAITR